MGNPVRCKEGRISVQDIDINVLYLIYFWTAVQAGENDEEHVQIFPAAGFHIQIRNQSAVGTEAGPGK